MYLPFLAIPKAVQSYKKDFTYASILKQKIAPGLLFCKFICIFPQKPEPSHPNLFLPSPSSLLLLTSYFLLLTSYFYPPPSSIIHHPTSIFHLPSSIHRSIAPSLLYSSLSIILCIIPQNHTHQLSSGPGEGSLHRATFGGRCE